MLATSSFARRVAVGRAFSAIRNATFAALLLSLSLFANSAFAQLTGTKNIPGDYATLDAAITDLNLQGVGAPGVTLNLVAANPQTAPLGGYSITTLTGAVGAPIVIQGNGNTITAPTPQASGLLNDAIFKIIGTDYVTLTGFTMLENPANTTTAAGTNNMTEWGVAVLYASTTDGAQNVTIQNNTIDLDRTYQNTFGIYSNSTHNATVIATSATATGAAGGNNNLKIYGNTITDVNTGIVAIGPTAAVDQNDNLDIGGTTAPTGNAITNFGTTGTFSTYANVSGTVNGILVRNNKNYNVSRNTISSSNGGVTSGTLNGIQVPAFSNTPTGTLTQTVNNNTISLRPGAVGITSNGINIPSGSVNATTTISINANDFNTFGHTVAGGTGAITFVLEGGNPLAININNNTFTNMSVNTTGTITFFNFAQSLISGASLSISGNQVVTGFTRTGVGTTTVWSANTSSVTGSSHAINNNNFSNITLTGASAFTGIANTDGASAASAPSKSVNGNTFNNISTGAGTVVPMSINYGAPGSTVNNNTISNITTGNSITGLLLGSSFQAMTAAGTKVGPITSAGTVVAGILTAAPSAVISKSKIYDLSGSVAGSVVSGIAVTNVTASSTVTLSNNLIGNLTAPIATSANGTIGISLTGSAATSNYNIFYNTVYLSNATSGVGFGSSGISTLASSTATTSALNLRNNIIVNTSVQNGAGLTVAYRRSSGLAGTLANYASTSNNNDFYAGTPGVSNLIYSDGTSSAQTIAAYKAGVFTAGTIAPRDSASISENPTFVSTVGSSPNFLHINTVTATQLESGATPVAGIADDFDGDSRNASTPDIGADEFNGVLLDLNPPNIVYTALGNTASTTARTLTATITDATGVPTAGAGLPVLYWRINAGSYTPATATSLGSNQYQFTFGAGVTTGDVVSYYVAAQDTAGTPNVGTNPSAGASGFTANPPAASTPPTTPNSYNISIPVMGSLNVGSAEVFTSLTNNNAQGIFKYLNDNAVTGNVVINITSDLALEDGAVALNEFAAPFTVTIKPTGGARIVSGAASTSMIRLNGASRVTFDGSMTGGTDRSLTIENTSVTTPGVFRLGSIGTTPIIGNTIKNSIIRNGVNTSSAVTVLDTAGAVAGYFNNITIQNNDVQKAFRGIFAQAVVAGTNGSGLLITGNTLNTAGVNSIRLNPIFVAGANGVTISNNTMGNISDANVEVPVGIFVSTGADNVVVSGNTLSSIVSTNMGAASVSGILISAGAAATNIAVSNNTISTLTSAGTGANFYAIGSFTPNVAISDNSISGMTQTGAASGLGIVLVSVNNNVVSGNSVSAITISGGSSITSGIQVQGASTNVTFERNKVFNIKNTNTVGWGANGIQLASTSLVANTTVRNNFVSDVAAFGFADSTASDNGYGMIVTSGAGYNIYSNSVLMNADQTATTGLPAAFNVTSAVITAGAVNVRNNLFVNTQTVGTQRYAIYSGAPNTVYAAIDFNDYVSAGPNLGFIGSNRATLADIITGFGGNVASVSVDPQFVSTTDLHLQTTSPVESIGSPIAAVTNDIDNDPRPATKPDIGADELVSALTITPTTVAFGNQLINTTSGEMSVTLANTGAGSLDVTTLTAAAAPFARTGTGTCAATLPITIAPSGSCTLTYTFAPTVAALASQVLTVTSNGPGSGTITMTGTGTQGNLTISPTTVAFGNQLVGSTGSTMSVTLSNTGTATLMVTALDSASTPFARIAGQLEGIVNCGTAPFSIPAGSQCNADYTFSPTATGPAMQVLNVTANAPGSGTITLTGNGVQGNLTITPTSIPFGNVTVNANSGPTAVTLANTGDASLIVTALSAPSAPFSRIGGNCTAAPITIAAGSSCTVSYQFAPTATGSFSDTVTVTANAPGSGTIGLSGTGVQGNLTISPTSIAFGNQSVNTTSSPTAVTLANTGDASLIVTTLSAPAAPFSRVGGNCSAAPITIAAGSSCTVSYQFAPTATGAFSDTVTVTANAPGSGTIGLSGTGIQGTLTITPNSVNFGTQTLNTTTAESTVTLANTGNASLDVTTLTAAAAPFTRTLTGTCSQTTPITIAASASCTLTYTFTPTATGPAGQTLTVTSSGAGSGTIALAGTGAGVGGACATGMPIEVSASAGLAGPTGYGTLKAGFDAINAGIHQNNIAVAVCGDTNELATAALNASGVGSSVYTAVLVAPANAGARTISGTVAAPLVDLNGADNVTIDGLNAGGNALTISNLSNAATAGTSTIRFIGGATNNMVVNTTLLGSSTTTLATAGGGTVYFATDAVALTGNDNNTISNNDIGPAGVNLPNKAVYGLGSTTDLANENSGVVINNNRIFDFFNPAASTSGIYVASGNDAWTISNNRIYQTAARTFTSTVLRYAGITLNSTAGTFGAFTVTGNVIGFAGANATGTTTISGSTNTFRGIDAASVNTTTPTSIQGNTISGINQTTASTGTGTTTQFMGIMLGSSGGRFNVGDVTGNTIGSLDGSSTIVVNASAGTGSVTGMYDFSSSSNTIANNNIGAITIQGAATTVGFRGILVNTATSQTETLTNNTIGGPAAAGGITNTLVGANSMYAFQITSATAVATGNIIRNLTANSTTVNGIVISGLLMTGSTGTSNVSRNTVHSLTNNAGVASNSIYALYTSFGAASNSIVERNLVHSLVVNSTAVTSQMVGILPVAGTATYRNNMVRLGVDATGASITTGYVMYGMFEIAGTNNIYNNSVYVGGTGVGVSTSSTYAFVSNVVTNARNYVDNIFWNARSNAVAGGGFHIAASYSGTTVNPAGLTANYNDLYATGTDGFVGAFNGSAYPTLAGFQAATGQDANSFSDNPQFIAPTGTALTVDLHISPTIATPIEGTGVAIASVTDDFDGEVRAGLTPTDVGADAGNFVPQIGNLTITPTSVLFGQVAVGVTSPEMSVVLANNGTGSLQVTALSAATTPFARTGTGTCSATLPITIAVGGSCTLTYTFSPTTNGPANQTLTVTANAPGSGTIALSGTGIQGNLSITPTNVPFGNQTVGTTSAAMAVNFTNVGNAPLMVTSLTAPAAPFATVPLGALEAPTGFVNCSAAPFTLAAGATCSIGYTFSPTATGAFTQMLTATTDGLGGGTITLSGTGVQGALTISPTLIAFGDQGVGTTSSTSSVTLSNTGNATLNVTTLTAAAAPFAQVGGSCGSTPIAIAAGANCTVSYTFAPTTIGAANQVLTVTSDAPGSGTITLTGNGVQGTLVVSPTTVDFGSPDVFTTTEFMSVTLTNTGTGSLQVNSLTLAAAPFQRTADGTCGNSLPITIAAGGSCTLTYKFAPTVAGLQSQNFTVSNNGSGGSGMFTLSGTGIDDRIFRDGFDGPAPPEAE